MSTNLGYIERERQRKRESEATGQRSSTRKGAREREKTKGDIFCWRNKMKFCSDGMLGATRVKMNDSEKKKVSKNTSDISSIKRASRKFLEVSRCKCKTTAENVHKKYAARAKLLFC